jgi:hypothetical protein
MKALNLQGFISAALPKAHKQLSSHFPHIDRGYIKVNWDIVSKQGQSAV